jgi:hypothetical protein
MAEILEEFNFDAYRSKRPWHEWLDGRVWKLKEGEDYTCTPASLTVQARLAAKKMGVKVRYHLLEGYVIVQGIAKGPYE